MSTNRTSRRTLTCVLRNLGDGSGKQYVPVSEARPAPGETTYTGQFNCQNESHGPSGSHRRTVCTPLGKLTEG